ncbi:6618_t:CDS:1, partial [Entrophospora sp. SA101]
EYENYENIQEIVHNLIKFFESPANCKCCTSNEQKEIRTYYKKLDLK